jgi:hypothetical protein
VDELIDICDENMTTLGTAMTSEAHRLGLWHHAVHCWLVRPEEPGRVLFQARGGGAALPPGLLDVTTSSHCPTGESFDQCNAAALRQMGLGADVASLVPRGTKIDVARLEPQILIHEFCHVSLLVDARRPGELPLDHTEVTGVVEISIPDGLELFADETEKVTAEGTEYDAASGQWRRVERQLGQSEFFPRPDPYYAKVFIMSERLLRQERHLAI